MQISSGISKISLKEDGQGRGRSRVKKREEEGREEKREWEAEEGRRERWQSCTVCPQHDLELADPLGSLGDWAV